MNNLFNFIKTLYPYDFVPLHEPVFQGNEKKYTADCIETTFVSSVGAYVTRFEDMMCDITGAAHAVAVVNGTCGLQIALECAGVARGAEVITQSLTFVGTANAITHAGAVPVFVDVDRDTLGLCPIALDQWLDRNVKDGINITTGRKVAAVMPVHIFGNPAKMQTINDVAARHKLKVIEDAAESLGSLRNGEHTGTFGTAGVFSFNGNKIVTAGGGGCIVTDDTDLAKRMKHLTTTAKQPHAYEFHHDAVGYNYRLTNLAAALACAQLEQLDHFLDIKRKIAGAYAEFLGDAFIAEQPHTSRNNWLNAMIVEDRQERDKILQTAHDQGIGLRPIWTLMSDLPMYQDCQTDGLKNSIDLANRVINLPSSANAKI